MFHYRVIKTGEIGKLVHCPSDDPVILEFKDGYRDAFHLRELEPTTQKTTYAFGRSKGGPNRGRGRPKGVAAQTVEKMLQIYRFIEAQSEPVYRRDIENAVGFNCTRPLMCQRSQSKQVTLESLGIVERLRVQRTWVMWKLTELGRRDGEKVIRRLKGGCRREST